jgi:hypothetical protein
MKPYRLPRRKAINTIIAGPAVITRNKETNCSKVVGLKNILNSPMIKSFVFLKLRIRNSEILDTYIVYSNTSYVI